MESCQVNPRAIQRHKTRVLPRLKLSDPKTDLFLGANAMDAMLTYISLQHGFWEFNSILRVAMGAIGVGPTLLLKVAFCVGALWILRRTNKEYLLVPVSAALIIVALSNLTLMRLNGIEV